MSNEQRFMDVLFEEAVQGKPAPDLIARTLARAQTSPETKPAIAPVIDLAERRATRRATWLRLAQAACVVFVAGLIAWVLLSNQTPPHNKPPAETTFEHVAQAAGTKIERVEGGVRLVEGWVVLETGAPKLMAEGATIEGVDGQVVVKTGDIPSETELAEKAAWLGGTSTEAEMLKNKLNWLKRGAVAALIVSGTAIVNGEVIAAPEAPAAPKEPVIVRTIADIEALPAETTDVAAVNVGDGHLEFIAKLPNLTILRVHGDITTEGVRFLGKCEKLIELNVERCPKLDAEEILKLLTWESSMPALKRLTIDARLVVGWKKIVDDAGGMRSYVDEINKRLESLSVENGVAFERNDAIEFLVNSFPCLKKLDVVGNKTLTDLAFRPLAKAAKLEELRLGYCDKLTDAAFAYVAQCPSLSSLIISNQFARLGATPEAHGQLKSALSQVAKLKGLNNLELYQEVLGDGVLEPLAKLSSLERLKLQGCSVIDGRQLDVIGKLSNLRELDLSRIERWYQSKTDPFEWSFEFLAPLDKLTVLTLGHSNAKADELATLPVLPALKRLVIHYNQHADSRSLGHFAKFKALEELDLPTPNKMTDSDLALLKDLPKLRKLRLTGTYRYLDPKGVESVAKRDVKELQKILPNCEITIIR